MWHHPTDEVPQKVPPQPCDEGWLHAAPTLPYSCQVQAAPGAPWGSCTASLQSECPGFLYESRIFPDHTSFSRFFSSSKGAFLAKTTKNGNSSMQKLPPRPQPLANILAFWFLKQELKINCLKYIPDFNSDLKKNYRYQLQFINHQAIFSVVAGNLRQVTLNLL